jgi:mRNA interferase MazF
MIKTVEAVIDERGNVRLLEPVRPGGVRRAPVTILEERPTDHPAEIALLSEPALAEDWDRPEEDQAWKHLQDAVVLVRFPFSDLSRTKLRPAVVLADAGRGDRVLCQVTSKPYGDSAAVVLDDAAFASGSLRVTSYARPGKLFTASSDLITGESRHADARSAIADRRRHSGRSSAPTLRRL